MRLKPKILDIYISKKFIGTFFVALLLIIGIVIIFDISEKIDDFVENEAPLKDLLPYVNAANVDLKAFSDNLYKSVCGASLAPVLRSLELMKEAGVWIEITNLLIPGVNDDMEMIRRMCRWLAAHGFGENPLHFTRFFPQYRMSELYPTPVRTLVRAREVAAECGIRHVYLGNV